MAIYVAALNGPIGTDRRFVPSKLPAGRGEVNEPRAVAHNSTGLVPGGLSTTRRPAGNRERMGLECDWPAESPGIRSVRAERRFRRVSRAVANNSKKLGIAVDSRKEPRLYTHHNEGGAPLAAKSFALVQSHREPRERHSQRPGAKSKRASRQCVCTVGSLTTEY
jgi:hypothetical protein